MPNDDVSQPDAPDALSAELRREWNLPDVGDFNPKAAAQLVKALADHAVRLDELVRRLVDSGRRARGDEVDLTSRDAAGVEATAFLRATFHQDDDENDDATVLQSSLRRQERLLAAFVASLSGLDRQIRADMARQIRPEVIEAATEQIGGTKSSKLRGSKAFKAACWDRYCDQADAVLDSTDNAAVGAIYDFVRTLFQRQSAGTTTPSTQAASSAAI